MVKINTDAELVAKIRKQLKDNGGYCPCALLHNPDTVCMCKDFRDKIKDPNFFGECHCGLYVKTQEKKQ